MWMNKKEIKKFEVARDDRTLPVGFSALRGASISESQVLSGHKSTFID